MSTLIICLVCLVVWVAPALIAAKRKHQSKLAIAMANLISVVSLTGYALTIAYIGHMDHGTSLVAGLGVVVISFISFIFWLIALIWSLAGVKK